MQFSDLLTKMLTGVRIRKGNRNRALLTTRERGGGEREREREGGREGARQRWRDELRV